MGSVNFFKNSIVCIKPKPKTDCTQFSLPIPKMHYTEALRDAGKEKFQTTHDAPSPGIRSMGSKRNRTVVSLLGMKKISVCWTDINISQAL